MMDYRKFAAGLRSAAGSYALFYGAPRGDLEKAADVIEDLAAKLEPSSTPLTLEELRGMDGEPVWVEFPKCPEASGWMLISASRHCVYNGLLGDCDFENCGRNWLACRRRPEALGGEAAPTLSRPKVGPREGKT